MFVNFQFQSRSRKHRQSGVALVVILSVIVFISILIALFLTTTSMNRQLSFSSAGRARAESIAFTGLETTIGDLRSEIVAGSTASGTNPRIYFSTTNLHATPYRVGDNGVTNLVKRSAANLAFWQGASYSSGIAAPVRAPTGNSTTNASVNGRYVRSDRWNTSYLLGSNTPAGFQAPDWILVTREGAMTNATTLPPMTVLADSSPGNNQYVIGRYAYLIFDEGGLLDVTSAGFPSVASPSFRSRRGTLPQVDLGLIPGINNASALVNWRNAASSTDYERNVFTNSNGFTEVFAGDRTFVSRQDLINYAKKHPDEMELSSLQYLGTFHRSLNAPSYTPPADRGKVGSLDDQINPSLVDVRVSTPFTRQSDGQSALVGEPLLKYRFPLSRLALFASSDPGANGQIERFFGLTRPNPQSPWIYRGGVAKILTLEEVADAGREPDFFELLQAGMTFGSTGATFVKQGSDVQAEDAKPDIQIIQVGANLIDQYDVDSFPTRIRYGNSSYDLAGIENLPYLAGIYETIHRYPSSDRVGMWYEAEVWNPHAQINISADRPTRFRFQGKGLAAGHVEAVRLYVIGPQELSDSSGVLFSTSSNTFTQPTILNQSVGATASGADDAGSFLGLNIGVTTIPLADMGNGERGRNYYGKPQSTLDLELQYFDPVAGDYVTYDRIRKVDSGVGVYIDEQLNPRILSAFLVRSDPRVDRFGVTVGYHNLATPRQDVTVRPDSGPGAQWGAGNYIGLFSDNLTTSATRYADPDGVIRPGDGAYAVSTGSAGYPLMTGNFDSRPVVLNRPFRSVAEMGYASRGTPWKHLDFFHPSSGDAALLDLFTINEPAYARSGEVRSEAGKINLNTRNVPVLKALLSGILKTEDTGATVTSAEVDALSQRLSDLTLSEPLLNRADLVTRFMPTIPANSDDSIVKRRREAVIRALADSSDTRTWNLFIDMIAQSGRYTPRAENLSDFQVQGERRYWLHLAIDRYTGEVVARQLEPVHE